MDNSTFERHYSLNELVVLWKLGRETIRKLIKDQEGVVRIRLGKKETNTRYSVPESVAVRIHTRLVSGV